MREIKETCYKGTRILLGNEKQDYIQKCRNILINYGFTEIQIPIIQHRKIFEGKVGKENNNLMYNFTDRGDRELCLAPEYTAVLQQLSKTTFKHDINKKLFYVAECFRGERPQSGRYRQFTQLGVEILNPAHEEYFLDDCINISEELVQLVTNDYTINENVVRGLDYYKDEKGFEISCYKLGSSKQVCGGGMYEGGVGFAIGIDRLINIWNQ